MLISNLKVTNSLKVDFTEFAWTAFIFDLNSFSDLLSFSSSGLLVHILEPTKVAVSVP